MDITLLVSLRQAVIGFDIDGGGQGNGISEVLSFGLGGNGDIYIIGRTGTHQNKCDHQGPKYRECTAFVLEGFFQRALKYVNHHIINRI